jgi:hypothetical protein
MRKPLVIGSCGPACAKRFYIVDADHTFWTGAGWSRNRREAALFDNMAVIGRKMHDLMIDEVPGQLHRYIAPVTVEVKSPDPVSLKALQDWLDQAVQVFLDAQHGTGPGRDVMVMMNLDWSQLKEES